VTAARFRQRQRPEELSEEELPYESWFAGPNTAESLVRIITLVCATGALLIAGGIFALRETAEGLGPAVAFGCLALALGLASFYNSFDTADDVAEHLDARAKKLRKIEKDAEKARQAEAIGKEAEAVATAESIRQEHEASGRTAAAGVRREGFAALGRSPGVAGNGLGRAHRNAGGRRNGGGS